MTSESVPVLSTIHSTPLSPAEEQAIRHAWEDFLDAINPDYHPTGVVPRLLATLDAERAALDGLRRLNADFPDSRGLLGWVEERLTLVHGDSPNADWMIRLRKFAAALTSEAHRG